MAEVGAISAEKADIAACQLLLSLRIDAEPVVRSNCIWALGRLYEKLEEPRCIELVDAFIAVLLDDLEVSVRDEARMALEQLENPAVRTRLQKLVEEGLIV